MKIEIFSDFACPFCYIAKTRLYEAITQLQLEKDVTIEYKAYQLNPEASKIETPSYLEALLERKGQSSKKVEEILQSIKTHASEVGLTYNFEQIKLANTENAHRLSKLAKTYGVEREFVEHIMHGYFTEGLNLNDKQALLAVCESLQIDTQDALDALDSERFSDELAKDRYDAMQFQISSVPFFVFEERYGIKGVEPIEVFTKTLLQAKRLTD